MRGKGVESGVCPQEGASVRDSQPVPLQTSSVVFHGLNGYHGFFVKRRREPKSRLVHKQRPPWPFMTSLVVSCLADVLSHQVRSSPYSMPSPRHRQKYFAQQSRHCCLSGAAADENRMQHNGCDASRSGRFF